MILAVCIEERGGVLFNGRRLSRDWEQQENLLALCPGRLWMTPASSALFVGRESRIAVDADCLNKAGEGEFCFWEAPWPEQAADRVEGVVLYRWNRAYPSDVKFPMDWESRGFVLMERTEFAGTSHERITREQYRKG